MNNSDFKKIEFWIATGLFLLTLFFLISGLDSYQIAGYNNRQTYYFKSAGIEFQFFSHYFIPRLFSISTLYVTFLILNYYLMPALFKKVNVNLNITWLIFLFFTIGLINSIIATYSKAYILFDYKDFSSAYTYLFVKNYIYTASVFLLIGLYAAVKIYLPSVLAQISTKYKNARIYQECLIAVIVWVFVFIVLATQTENDDFGVIWFFGVPIGILYYGFSLNRLIPDLKAQGKGVIAYLWRSVLLIALASCLLSLIALFIMQDEDAFTIPFVFNLAVHSFITTPLCLIVYNYRLKNKSEISYLKQELGKSDASLSFLQSQINPHFLFNALNTLYGTALQENAERTGEGIQKLGDMMRFMLHENVQDKISLTRDVDYLENYISLQKLRTSRSADIIIDTQIDEQLNNLEITPMLLIPFVENAFKHGISLQQPSYIKVTLQTKDRTLYFDVHNSIHIKPDNDPEKFKSGIGLQNVKQRLALLYPGKHELIIRESAKEFFIHLTMQL
jgi:two-component system LytT family sensor kinase